MNYVFKATKEYWHEFNALPKSQQASALAAWKIFRLNPFDPRLGTHKIYALSARARHPIWSVVIEGDLRSLFRLDGNVVTSLVIGSHNLYR